MTTNISINLPVPSISKDKYIELTGLPEDTVDAMLKDGRLPRHRLRKDMGREKVMINIAALTIDALAGCNIVLN
ncbi:TPA: regulator [Citrobacter farmeri]|uniref:Cox transcriptional regulator n=1 Tax=Escherichia phage ESSI2_ev040 TaxID=2695849 RepID=A0A653FVN1_9CAUD|nr:Cox-like excisionase and repressor [Escherichia phage ESSI2_ev040]HCB1655558.1 regulator [Citrobacter farmeri]HCQ7753551.1 regulator [Citrobacter sedlakii]VUF53770.1 Cox transcriptional regulator [Escherichia phage ESSI2_ev040]HCB1660422.1 regulator [Citrobacter farmeri]HCB1666886.1 regulator [Citrobacter farmeri]